MIVRAAVVQDHFVMHDAKGAVEHASALVRKAAEKGAELAVFPEAFIGGYPKGSNFGTVVGFRSPDGREEFQRYAAGAIEVPGPSVNILSEAVGNAGIHAIIGVIEREGGTLYCSTLIFSPDGRLAGKHRKLMPTAAERLIWGFGDGSTLPVIDTPIGKIGSAVCWENYMPMLRMALYGKGVELYCVSTVDDRDQWQATMRHIALEGRCFVLASCPYHQLKHCPASHRTIQGEDPETVMIRGGSVIFSPLGECLAGPVYGESAILTADLDMGEILRGRYDFDPVGHYARPDVFQLSVDERPKKPVTGNKTDLP
jgi:nitrilase